MLAPAVRNQPKDTLIEADGFSCRQQIAQATDRRALHLAQVLDMAYATGETGEAAEVPERGRVRDYADEGLPSPLLAVGVAVIALLAGTALRRRFGAAR